MDSSLTQLKRELRKSWADEEAELAHESATYAKRRLSLIEFLINVANSQYQVSLNLQNIKYSGYISEVGQDYIAVSKPKTNGKHYLQISQSADSKSDGLFSIEIHETKSEKKTLCNKSELRFKSLICDLNESQSKIEIQTKDRQTLSGTVEVYKDFISLNRSTTYDMNPKLVMPLMQVVPISNILLVSVAD